MKHALILAGVAAVLALPVFAAEQAAAPAAVEAAKEAAGAAASAAAANPAAAGEAAASAAAQSAAQSAAKAAAEMAAPPAMAQPAAAEQAAAPASAQPQQAASAAPAADASQNMMQAIQANAQTSTLAKLIQAAGLASEIQNCVNCTMFAPSDEAFAKLSPATLESLQRPENQNQLKQIIGYHASRSGKVAAAQISGRQSMAAMNGQDLNIMTANGQVRVNNTAVVTAADQMASNGVIHIIDSVLLPAPMTASSPATVAPADAAAPPPAVGDQAAAGEAPEASMARQEPGFLQRMWNRIMSMGQSSAQ